MSSPMLAERDAPCRYFGDLIDLDVAPSADFVGAFATGEGVATSLEGVLSQLRMAAPGSLQDVTISGRPSVSKFVENLRRWGVALAPGLLPESVVRSLDSEFSALMAARGDLAVRVDEELGSTCIRLETKRLDSAAYPTVATLFASPVLRAIADAYFDDTDYSFNHALYVHKTEANDTPPSSDLHFDVTRMLKFWINLSDSTVANGAMRCVPGSHLWLRLLRRDYSARRTPKKFIPNLVEGADAQAIHLVGPSGTMFVFDTDVAHGASPVAVGGERRIIRGHCTETELIARAKARG